MHAATPGRWALHGKHCATPSTATTGGNGPNGAIAVVCLNACILDLGERLEGGAWTLGAAGPALGVASEALAIVSGSA